MPEVVADELTPEIIDAAVSFVELAASTEKNKGKKVYYSEGCGISLTSERIRQMAVGRCNYYLHFLLLKFSIIYVSINQHVMP